MNEQYVEHKFKDVPPEETIEKIRQIMRELGIELEEKVRDADVGNCYSAHVWAKDSFTLFSNGKGVTRELARASAYAEFIERLQCGLFFYKLQSFNRFKELDLQSYAPDGKYVTVQELEQTADWMDALIASYGRGLTRKKLANLCKIYACAEDDKILTVPYYSLFEDRYVYMPAAFVEHMYASNGCCAGNSREEAWVHAFSEIMERHCMIHAMISGRALPKITDQIMERVPLARQIIEKIRSTGKYDIEQFDLSNNSGFPVIGTRIINKADQRYVVNAAADPIFEIAVSRGLTEIMQGRKLENISSFHDGSVLADMRELPLSHNLINQLETGNGVFAADFFSEELACGQAAKEFPDATGKTNQELLQYAMDVFRKTGKQVYVRNYSFLGFHTYHFVVPGFSEFKWMRMFDRIPEYAMGDEVVNVFRDPAAACDADLAMMLAYYKKIRSIHSLRFDFSHLAGLPLVGASDDFLWITLAYACHRLGDISGAVSYLSAFSGQHTETAKYFNCVCQYLKLTDKGISPEKIRVILDKFNYRQDVERLYNCLSQGKTPFDDWLFRCDPTDCSQCQYRKACCCEELRRCIAIAGARYSTFTGGQDREVFRIK